MNKITFKNPTTVISENAESNGAFICDLSYGFALNLQEWFAGCLGEISDNLLRYATQISDMTAVVASH